MKSVCTLNDFRLGGGMITIKLRSITEVPEANKIVDFITTNYNFSKKTSSDPTVIQLVSSDYQCYEKPDLTKIYKEAKKSLLKEAEEQDFMSTLFSKKY